MASITLNPKVSDGKRMLKMIRTKEPPTKTKPSLAGKTVLITGSSNGIGLACARMLPSFGLSHLIMAVRSIDKGEKAAAEIRKAHPNTKIDVWTLDMLSYDSIQAFVRRCTTLSSLEIAILNVGIGNLQYKTAPLTGHEETMQVNYISTTLIAILLLPILKRKDAQSEPGRLSITGSSLGNTAKFTNRNTVPLLPSFDNPKEWKGMASANERYSVSKTFVMMLTLKLSQLVSADDVVINSIEPGFTAGTGLFGNEGGIMLRLVMGAMHALMARTADQAAWTYVDGAMLRGKETHGSWLVNWEIYPFHEIMYTEEGRRIMQRLWDETLQELQAYGVREALDVMHKN